MVLQPRATRGYSRRACPNRVRAGRLLFLRCWGNCCRSRYPDLVLFSPDRSGAARRRLLGTRPILSAAPHERGDRRRFCGVSLGPAFPADSAVELQEGREDGCGRRVSEAVAHDARTMKRFLGRALLIIVLLYAVATAYRF